MPRLETERLLLRPPEYCDVDAITRWIGDCEVAKNMGGVPHPFTEADGRAFVTQAHAKRALGEGFCFAILDKKTEVFLGCCALMLSEGRYRIGYWLGKPYWNRGYATEAVKKLAAFAFHDLRAEQVWASWFNDNPASGRVLEKLGFRIVETYDAASLARGRSQLCNRTTLRREEFGRRVPNPPQQVFAAAVGA
jgi:[ribosomal protein S5]-alanine N-acetyltransferase